MSKVISGVEYEDGRMTGVQISGILEYGVEEPVTAYFSRVVHGRWISLTECANEGVYCSICKKKVWKSDYAWCSKKSRNKLRSNYCPNCGAKMDGGDGND